MRHRRWRRIPRAACVLIVALAPGRPVCAADPETEPAPATFDPGPGWEHLVSLRTFAGYKDNVLLAPEDPEGSPFLGAELEWFGTRPAGPGRQFQGLVVGEHRQYLSAESVEREQTLVAEARLDQELGLAWAVSAPLDFTYLDQVLDVSATESVPPTRIQSQSIAARPALRWMGLAGTLEMQWRGVRQWYAAPLDDTWETGVRLDWAPAGSGTTRANLYYDFSHAWYDSDPARDGSGAPLPGTRREMQRHEGGVRVRHEWGAAESWRLSARLGGRYASDRVDGYYDYIRPSMDLRLRHRRRIWSAEAGMRLSHYRYPVQSASPGIDRERQRLELATELRGEVRLLSWLRAYAVYSYEETFANRDFESYTVNTVLAGLEAGF